MVYESRPGELFVLGASTWRIEDITFERVTVTPAPGQPGKMPFWHGDRPGRPLELGRALGAFVRELREVAPGAALKRLRDDHALDELAANNLLQYVTEQAEATGVVPDDRTIVVERFRDEIGDWRVCVLSPFGTPVHAPWAMAIERRLADRFDIPVESMWGDDGIVLRLPESADDMPIDAIQIDPEDIEELVVSTLPQTALFSVAVPGVRRPIVAPAAPPTRPAHAAVAAAPTAPPTCSPSPPSTRRSPCCWRRRRECLQDVFDVPALREVLGQLRSRAVRIVSVETQKPSPMAQSLLFNWIAAYMYEGDAPLAERRAAALALDRDLLADLLGAEELRELLDPGVLADVELDLQHLSDGRRARTADELHDVLRRVGDLSTDRGRAAVRAGRGHDGCERCSRDARRRAPGDRDRHRGGAAVRRRRRRRPLPRRPRLLAAARAAAGVHRARAAAARRPRRPLRAHPRSVRRPRRRRRGSDCRSRERSARSPRSRPTSASSAASSVPTACVASGATSTCSASCAAARCRCCARRSSRSSRPCSPSSCRRGRASATRARGSTRSSRRSASSPARRSWRRRSSATCSRHGSTSTARRCSTSCAPPARWCGSAPARSVRTTGGSGSASSTRWRCSRRRGTRSTGPKGALHDQVRDALKAGGASFWSQLRAGVVGPDRRRAARRAVGPRVGGRGLERLDGGAAGDDHRRRHTRRAGEAGRLVRPQPGPADPARPHRPGHRRRSLEPRGPAARAETDVHCGRPRRRDAARRADGRRHPRGRARRGRRRRVCVGVPGAQGARGARPGPPRLLRQRPRRRPVRGAGGRRSAALAAARRRPGGGAGAAARAVGHRPRPAVRRRAGLARLARPPGAHRRRGGRDAGGRAARVARPPQPPPRHVHRPA